MANALALLGWGPPDEVEIRPMAEIVELFSLETVNKAAAMFDVQKLGHINAEYIKALSGRVHGRRRTLAHQRRGAVAGRCLRLGGGRGPRP